MEFIVNLMQSTLFFGGLIFLIVALVVNCIYLNIKMAGLKKRYDCLMVDKDGKSIEDMVLTRLQDLSTIKKDIEILSDKNNELSDKLIKCVQKVGVVRFNAFDDMGSDLSFAIALLDDKNNGVVISSIYGRNDARCYAKPIENSNSKYSLSDEEKQAIINSKKV